MHSYTDPPYDSVPDRTGYKLFFCYFLALVGFVLLVYFYAWGRDLFKGTPGSEISAKRYERIEALDHWGPTHNLIVECMRDGKIDWLEEQAIHDRYAKELLDELKWRLAN